ncbi:hypothetical protein LOZ53_004706 [Ophidiomyces ophidiicola]|nr:hypothetical protein LOZ55_000660 [Ophidiomyces ophidiicola]KAI1985161.1 hypothetical protein LOZ54_004281 [Ophidiomyces ophidiicola]KAI1986357.1 hypothetical protein LOZ53_004706 [Ophidiomyces ophidiicola]KAI1998649.1 hypothetical protein LOZ51_002383 [Ophidiomyces ophidiicola]
MAPMTEEDIEWFKSTFHPIPKPEIPEDCIEYSLYCIPNDISEDDTVASRAALGNVQKAASKLVKKYLKDYIWQRENFRLEQVKEDGVNLLRGRTVYGDSIEDEWVIVYILRELTREFDDLWVKVTDSDGEFLLVEAAATLPAWLEPEIANNRVWIHRGELVILRPAPGKRAKNSTQNLTFQDARNTIRTEPGRLIRSSSIQEEAFYRLRNYPAQIIKNMHTSLVTIPRTIAYILHIKPAYVAPAIEAFYIRDPIALRALQSKDKPLIFEPDDLVTTSVKFTKVGFAQLKSQDFDPPGKWKTGFPSEFGTKEYARAEIGMKLGCGFEMLLFDPQNQDNPMVREMKLVLEDIEAGDERLPSNEEIDTNWEKLEDDESWLDINYEDLDQELTGKRSTTVSAKMSDFGDKTAQENLQRIVAQFEQFLNDDTAGFDGADFIEESDDSEVDDQDSSSDGEDKEASFDEEEFSRMMREMMGLPPPPSQPNTAELQHSPIEEVDSSGGEIEKNSTKPQGSTARQLKPMMDEFEMIKSNKILRDELYRKRQEPILEEVEFSDEEGTSLEKANVGLCEDKELEEIQDLSRQMESELKKAGILDHHRVLKEKNGRSLDGKAPAPDIEAAELIDEVVEDSDVGINLAKNLLESLRSQGGAPGPGSNLLGLMGGRIPKDDRG